jgi:periplasmic protein TonB
MVERRLFGNLVVSDDAAKDGRRGRTLPVSLAVHGVVLAAVVIVPLMSAGEVPPPTNSVRAFFTEPVVPAPAPPPPPPPPPAVTSSTRQRTSTPAPSTTALVPPTEISDRIEPDEGGGMSDGMPGGDPNGVPDGTPGGVPFGVVGMPVTTSEPPPILRVGGNVKPPTKIKDVKPVYPALARSARMQGMVILECTIDPHGRVQDVRVLRGIPLLDQAATDAVRQWAYTPTLLNGVPTAVIMTVTVGFTLQ